MEGQHQAPHHRNATYFLIVQDSRLRSATCEATHCWRGAQSTAVTLCYNTARLAQSADMSAYHILS